MARMLLDNHGRAIPETCLTADQVVWMDSHPSSAPKTPFEAAIDKATGFKPGEEDGGFVGEAVDSGETASVRQQDGTGEGVAEVGTASETKPAEDETKAAEVKENAAHVKEKRDWVKEAYECFVKNAVDSDPTDPVKAIAAYFEKNATDELKAKVEHEGKTARGCWKFIEAVARKALGGRSGHIDPVTVYAIAMHYFQDVPKDWDKRDEKPARREAASVKTGKVHASIGKKAAETRKTNAKIEKLKEKIAQPGSAKHAQELKAKLKAEKERVKKKEKKQKAKKRGGEQGFFFNLMEMETVGPEDGQQAYDNKDGREAGDAE